MNSPREGVNSTLTLNGLTVVKTRQYDGTNVAKITNWGTLDGIVSVTTSSAITKYDVEIDKANSKATFDSAAVGNGKTITFKALAMTSGRLPKGTFIPGRNAMTCCEEDVRFFGFLCKYDKARTLKKGTWVTVTAKIAWEYSPVYTAQGVVLYAERVEPADPPADPMIYFR